MSSLPFAVPDPTLPVEEPAHSTRQATRLAAGPTSELPLNSAAPTSQRIRKVPRDDSDDISQSDPQTTSGIRLQVGDSVAAAHTFPLNQAAKGGTTKTPKAKQSTLASNPTQGVVPVVSQTTYLNLIVTKSYF